MSDANHSAIRHIVFDWGGVLQRTEDHAPRLALDRELGLSPGSVERAVFASEVWDRASRGACAAVDLWRTLADSVGYDHGIEGFVKRFFAGDRVDPRLVELVENLRAAGYPVGLLSNAVPSLMVGERALGRWGQPGLFDVQVFSYEVGVLKPHPRAYGVVLDAMGADPAETCFIDDSPANVRGARDAGMVAIRFAGVEALIERLGDLGVQLGKDH